MLTVQTLSDCGLKLLAPLFKVVNGFPSLGVALCMANQYGISLEKTPVEEVAQKGTLTDGRLYEVVYRDMATGEEATNGVSHHFIAYESNGHKIGRIQIRSGEKYIDELERVVRFNGWYIFDMFVDPRYRGIGVSRGLMKHALTLAQRSDNGGQHISAFIHVSNVASKRAFESLGFSKRAIVVFIKLFGRRAWIIKKVRPTEDPPGIDW